ncbi:MAG: thymidine phosphorylase [Gemmatimonadetes bacterium]|nr:thymidine phosphorylase [Gemmatimonadota bacterium]
MSDSSLSVVALIERKKHGEALTPDEIRLLLRGLVNGEIPDYQIAAWLMAVYFQGMTDGETLALTLCMVESGATLDWSHLPRLPVDKHSTGGVGDKTSLVLVPLMAAAGLPFVKMSGRGLGHTGGTLDKLESIAGFSVDLSIDELRRQIDEIGCALVGQSATLVPADGLLYALRDVTGTVDSLPLIASSIMSKKIAGGAGAIVLDVKYGSGAFMRQVEHARALAHAMVRIGEGAGRRVGAVLSSMEEPLGRTVGNALEVREAIETLRGDGPGDLRDLALELGTRLLLLAGDAADAVEARAFLEKRYRSGAALERFERLVAVQGGDTSVFSDLSRLPTAPVVSVWAAPEAGWVARVDARGIADTALALGAGRRQKTDDVDPAVGVVLLKKTGERVEVGEPLVEIHARTDDAVEEARRLLSLAYTLSPAPSPAVATPHEVIMPAAR